MSFLEAVGALISLASLIGAVVLWYWPERSPVPPVEADLAAPYREALHAAVRMQSAAQDLERQIYVEAARHVGLSDTEPL